MKFSEMSIFDFDTAINLLNCNYEVNSLYLAPNDLMYADCAREIIKPKLTPFICALLGIEL